METPTTQDPNERFTLLMEEFRALPGTRTPVGPVALMIEQLFVRLLRLLAGFTARVRAGALPVMAPAAAAEQSHAWPSIMQEPGLRPRESRWV